MIVVDVETTGFSPSRHGIISIGAIEFEKPQNQFYSECRIDTKTAVDEQALAVNGFTLKAITDLSKPSLAEIIRKFSEWIERIPDKTIGGHNTIFDVGMLRAAFRKAKLDFDFAYQSIDMHNLAYMHMKRGRAQIPINKFGFFSIKANGVFEYVGLPDEPTPHNALVGAKMEAEAMSRLIHGQNLLAEFKQFSLPNYLN